MAINSDHMMGMDPDHAMNSFNPLLMLYVATARKTDRGHVHGPQQRLDRMSALRTVTTHAAWLSFDESNRGSIEPGKLADLAILDGDYLGCDDEAVRTMKVSQTLVGGQVVYSRP